MKDIFECETIEEFMEKQEIIYGLTPEFEYAIELGKKAGIEAAKKAVPKEKNTTYTSNDGKEYNECRDETLKNLESLSLDSTKE